MARGTQHRKRRPAANARVAQPAPKAKGKGVKHQRWEDQLFFSRLRLHAKWVFVFLVAAFGLGFVLFGVGSGSSGIGQVMQNFFSSSSSGSASISSLQHKVQKHPKDPKPWRDLASRLEQDQKVDRAIVALQHYVRLQPKDQAALEELAGLYVRRASDYYNIYRQVLADEQLVSDNSVFRPAPSSALGKAFQGQDPILAAASGQVSAKANAALARLGLLNSQSEGAYKRLVKLAPDNATYQLQLAQVAANLHDTATAKPAYKAFLKLAPNDPLAASARQALKQLSAPTTTKTAPTTTKTKGR